MFIRSTSLLFSLWMLVLLTCSAAGCDATDDHKRVPRIARLATNKHTDEWPYCAIGRPNKPSVNGGLVTRLATRTCYKWKQENQWAFEKIGKTGHGGTARTVYRLRSTFCKNGDQRLCECLAPDGPPKNGTPLIQYNCLDAQDFPDDVRFYVEHCAKKGWKIQHVASKLYVSHPRVLSTRVKLNRKPYYWDLDWELFEY